MKPTRLFAIAALVIAGSATPAVAEADPPAPPTTAPAEPAPPAEPALVEPIVLPLDCVGEVEYTQNASGSWDATYVVDCHGPDLAEGPEATG